MRIKLSYPLSLKEISNALNNHLTVDDAMIEYISTDTRELFKNDLFFALSGKTHCGEDFTNEARELGAYVVARKNADITVNDVADALLLLSQYYKSKLKNLYKTVAVTGSVGKTTTKEILSALLSARYRTHSTEKNLNNQIGISYTVLSAPADTEILVIEAGMNHKGELLKISKAISPDIAIITNVKDAHIGNFHSREEIASAKLEIACENKTKLIVPHEEKLFSGISDRYTVSLENPEADFYMSVLSEGKTSVFDAFTSNSCLHSVKVNLYGRAYMEAVLYAIAVCDLLSIKNDLIVNAISKLNPAMFRKKIYSYCGYTIIDDTYSASPEAVLYELEMGAKSLPASCILGDMLELGEFSEEKHRLIGSRAYALGYRRIYAFGKYANEIARGAILAGMNPKDIHQNTDKSSPKNTANAIFTNSLAGETLLFKGSHEVHCERIIEHFENIVKKTSKE